MKCILFGGSGEVGGAVARDLIKSDVCSHLTMMGRQAVPAMQAEAKVEQIVVDTTAADFEKAVKDKAQGHDVAISCVGIGRAASASGEKLMEVEVHMVGRHARGCKAAGIEVFELLTAVGSSETQADSRIGYIRVMGQKHKTVVGVGFKKLAIFKPGAIVGNAHTPRWVTFFTGLIPDFIGWGNILQEEVARAFVAHLEKRATVQPDPIVAYGNKEMKLLIRES